MYVMFALPSPVYRCVVDGHGATYICLLLDHITANRFQIEDVREEPLSPSPRKGTTSADVPQGSSPSRHTVTSLGYDTSEAVPMTTYYRDGEEEGGGGGKARPSLDYLRDRSGAAGSLPPPDQVSGKIWILCSFTA